MILDELTINAIIMACIIISVVLLIAFYRKDNDKNDD